MSRVVQCQMKGCPAYGMTFTQMTANDGSCGICGWKPSKNGVAASDGPEAFQRLTDQAVEALDLQAEFVDGLSQVGGLRQRRVGLQAHARATTQAPDKALGGLWANGGGKA